MYDFKSIEQKWRKKWEDSGIYNTPEGATQENKYYILPQLPYPSGSGLHVGHAEVYSACDILARFKRMKDRKVLQVIGWDAFGLPAENYAIKTNVHPRINTDKAIDNFREQIQKMGVSVDWDREVGSHNPGYYKWTQWFFLLMYNQGLAYRKEQKVNWCDSCKTVLANEQVVDDKGVEVCERCDTPIEHKMMEQWYLKITEYADRLADDLDKVDWPAETVKRQRDWIGRSEGAQVKFDIVDLDKQIEAFTTRPDTLFGATYMVLAPEHALVEQIVTDDQREEVEKYIEKAAKKTEIERTDMTKEKTGVFTGAYAVNPATGNKIPVWIADYVLTDYGTGAIMAVPAHDERDWDFAVKYELPIIEVVEKPKDFEGKVYTGKDSVLINSGEFSGKSIEEGQKEIIKWLEENGLGESKVTYKLRDWSVSRQRFWGAPIPFLHRRNGNTKSQIPKGKYLGKPDAVINFHAWASNSNDTYHPWVGKELEKMEVDYIDPDLPSAEKPVLKDWVDTIETQLREEYDLSNYVVTGRSLGGWSALKFAENHKLRKLVLVAPTVPHEYLFGRWRKYADEETMEICKTFVGCAPEGEVDFEKVNKNVEEVVVLISRDDPYIDYDETVGYLRERILFVRIKSYRDAGHFKGKDGYAEFPALLEELTREVRPDLKPVFESDLPVLLPDDVDFKPTGQSPLTYSKSFNDGVKEEYGEGFEREPDTLDTFMCSSWYYFRYLDPHNDEAFASEEALKKWMPVDFYLGGPEHVNGHLLYSRFFTKVLYDAGYIDFDEPFMVHRHQGLILGEDNRKMSKRWGNVVNPSDVVDEHGADTLRMYEMFMGPLEDTKPWSSKSVLGIKRFLNKVWNLNESMDDSSSELEKQKSEINKLIKKVEADIEDLSFNTAIAKMMEFVNMLSDIEKVDKEVWKKFLLVLAPFAPFITEELWGQFGNGESIHSQDWPEVDEEKILEEDVNYAVMVDGKVRDSFSFSRGASQSDIEVEAKKSEKIQGYLEGKDIKKVIFVQDKIINFVI